VVVLPNKELADAARPRYCVADAPRPAVAAALFTTAEERNAKKNFAVHVEEFDDEVAAAGRAETAARVMERGPTLDAAVAPETIAVDPGFGFGILAVGVFARGLLKRLATMVGWR